MIYESPSIAVMRSSLLIGQWWCWGCVPFSSWFVRWLVSSCPTCLTSQIHCRCARGAFFGLYRILTFSDFHVDFVCSLSEYLLSFLLLGIWTERHCNRPATCNMEQHGEKHRLQGNAGQLPLQIRRWAGQKVTESTSYLITIFSCSYSSRTTLDEWREPSED